MYIFRYRKCEKKFAPLRLEINDFTSQHLPSPPEYLMITEKSVAGILYLKEMGKTNFCDLKTNNSIKRMHLFRKNSTSNVIG